MPRKKAEKQPTPPIANENTTDIQVPQTMDISPITPDPEDDIERFDPRKDIMAEISANRKKILEQENQTAVAQAEQHTSQSAPETEATQSEEVVAESATAADPQVQDTPAEVEPQPIQKSEKYTIVVDGQPVEYTIEELKQQAQLGVGARKRFDEAAKLRQEAESLMFTARNSQPQAVDNVQPDISEAELRDIAKRMNYGSEEDQVKALKDAALLFNKNTGRQMPTPEQLVSIATQNAVAYLDVRNEQDILKNEFKDIVSDPAIAQATDVIANQLAVKYQTLGQPKTRIELLREAGNTARERYLIKVQPELKTNTVPETKVAPMQEKLERKRTAPQQPQAANRIATQAPQEARFTPSSIVANMRKSRGQAAY